MVTNVKIERNTNENAISTIRRFTKRVQGSGILPRMRRIRYHKRPLSQFLTKKRRITSLKRKENYEELVKLGKVAPRIPGRRFQRK